MSPEHPVTRFGEDTTLRWPCRQGDFILWLTVKGLMHLMGRPENAWTIADCWELRNGDSVTITNRIEDLPPWFKLLPTEVCGQEALAMWEKLKAACKPGEIMDGPNIWRVRAGDRVAWVGPSRPGTQATDGLLSILAFGECALVIGESNRTGLQDFVGFGSLTEAEQRPETVERCHRAIEAVRALGLPRTIAEEWLFG